MVHPQLDPGRFANRIGDWLESEGPEADVVVSCRVRLARNVSGYPFVDRLEPERAEELSDRLRTLFDGHPIDGETIWVSMAETPPLLQLLLRERHLISRELVPKGGERARSGRAVAFGTAESSSAMVNEEDHLRLQGLASGLDLRAAFQRASRLDRALENDVGFACNEQLGYLTSCPTNVGTGMRASVMLHLPALGLVRSELEKVFTAAQRTGLTVRGMYGEGSRAAGDFYQISNQVTLGCSEEELIEDLETLVPCIVDFERRVRKALWEEQQSGIENRVRRSYGMLRTARSLPTEVALLHLSNVRLGACLDILEGIAPSDLNAVAIQVQKGHVCALTENAPSGSELPNPTQRDRLRASFLRRRMAELT